MKTKIALAGLLATLAVVETSAQRAEFDDMYFRAKDREKISKAVEARDVYASAKTKKQKSPEAFVQADEGYTNPTDSYSARNINPEYVSRSNAEQASEDESNYYLEGYTPSTYNSSNFNNSYYNNANWARSSYYGNALWNSPYYGYGMGGMRYYDPWMNPYYGGFYDPWMMPSYGYGFGPAYGWRSGWSVSLSYGSFWNPYGGWYSGYGNPYYGGFGYPGYYYGGGFYESPRVVNYGKRPSRHSAVVQPTQRTRTQTPDNVARVNSGQSRQRQAQDEYYVRPIRRTSSSTSTVDNPTQRNAGGTRSSWSTPSSTPTRSRDSYSSPTSSPSYTPSSSPSRGSSGGTSSGSRSSGGSSSPRPRGN